MKHNMTVVIKAVSLMICAALILSASAVFRADAEKSLDELQSELDSINAALSQKQDDYDGLNAQIGEQKSKLGALNGQISNMDAQLDALNAKIKVLNTQLVGLNREVDKLKGEITALGDQIQLALDQIAEKERQIKATKQLLLERLRATYIAGNSTELEVLLSSDDLSSFLTRSELLQRVAENDDRLIRQLEKDQQDLAVLTKKLAADKAELVTKKEKIEKERTAVIVKQSELQTSADAVIKKQNDIEAKRNEVNKILATLDTNSEEYRRQIEFYESQRDKADSAIEAYIRAHATTTVPSTNDDGEDVTQTGDGMAWPVPYSNCYISSYFGYRDLYNTGNYRLHKGIDICVSGGSYGKKIVAAAGGNVMIAGYHSSYGNYITIDHGNGLVTLYAHCSVLSVSVGDHVNKGQKIAEIGSTGDSTGPHLHFGVFDNASGQWKNPLNYVSMP